MIESILPFAFAGLVGFGHAFEADHLVAVGNIVTKRDRMALAIKDGVFWGLGHSSTIFFIGLIIIVLKASFLDGLFSYFEALVGLMLIGLGAVRLTKAIKMKGQRQGMINEEQEHGLAYRIGLIHGLAGSGAMIVLVMTEFQNSWSGMLYLLIFGLGSVIGMLVAAGLFGLPFSKRFGNNVILQTGLVVLSAVFCLVIGCTILIENL